MKRAGAYVASYEERLSALIAEERYEQRLTVRGFNRWSRSRTVQQNVQSRDLRSDVLIVRRRAGGLPWLLFRDIFEVDGREVRDRADRLEALFVARGADGDEQAQAIADEGARYNIGPILRNYNVPTLVLAFLHPSLQDAFRFEGVGETSTGGRRVIEVSFTETRRPTVIRGATAAAAIPARGRVWIAPGDGVVTRTELLVEDLPGTPGLAAQLDTRFQAVAELGLWAPVEMEDRWQWPSQSCFFEGKATYTNFRRPRVEVEESYTVPE
jgi:hypothetical protein